MLPQTFHLLAFGFGQGRVVSDQIPGYEGFLVSSTSFWLLVTHFLTFLLDFLMHHSAKAGEVVLVYYPVIPRCLSQKTTHTRHTLYACNCPMQMRHRVSFFTHQQAKEHG